VGALYTPGTVVSSRPAVHFPAGTCRFPAASPCTPLKHSVWRGPNVTRPHQGFTRVHPSGLPLACAPRTDRESLGVFSELRTPPLPATHVRAGTGHGHWPGITPSASADLLSVNPLNLCDLVSHRPGVPGPQQHGQALAGIGEPGAQRMEAIALLPGGSSFLFLQLAQVRGNVCKVGPAAPGFVSRVACAGAGPGRRCRRGSGPGRCRACRARRRSAWGRGR
jgi:hypothetical protein